MDYIIKSIVSVFCIDMTVDLASGFAAWSGSSASIFVIRLVGASKCSFQVGQPFVCKFKPSTQRDNRNVTV